eukprot:UN06335
MSFSKQACRGCKGMGYVLTSNLPKTPTKVHPELLKLHKSIINGFQKPYTESSLDDLTNKYRP